MKAQQPLAVQTDAGADAAPTEQGTPGATDLMHRLLKLTNRLMAPFTTHLASRHKISLNEFRLLMTLGRYGDKASHELAAHTGVNVMSVSRAVAALARHGRIRVAVDPANRRRKRLSLTDQGRELYELMRPEGDRVADYLLSRLSPRDVAALDRIVDTLLSTLEETDLEGRSLLIERTRPGDSPYDSPDDSRETRE